MSTLRTFFAFALAVGFIWVGNSVLLHAADDRQETTTDKSPKAESTATTDEETKSEDRFVVPEGGVEELMAFLKQTMAYRPTTREELKDYQTRGLAAMKAAAEKILDGATRKERQLDGFSEVEAVLLNLRAREVGASPAERQKLVVDIKKYLRSQANPSQLVVQAAKQCASSLERGGGSQEQAVAAYSELGAVLSKSKNPQAASTGLQMEGAARRLALVGNAMKLKGTQIDGKSFNLTKLRGKVVLVDFWATWCGPCMRELPNVKENYDLYHDKGFEVVSISLDNDRSALDAFLEKEQPAWITLYDGPWSDNAVAQFYGVMGIPTVILIDQDGKVVSTQARGPVLGKQLEKLLGPAEPSETSPAADASAAAE